jgi:zinc resistance-associated protein
MGDNQSMPRVLELLRWKLQALFAWKPTRAQVLPLILGVYALAGWGAYANKASANRDLATQVTLLQAERNELVGRQKALEQANIDLGREWQGKLASAREELGQAFAARDAAKSQLASSQRELTASKKRLDQARDRVTETGSIKPAEPSKKAASKP